MVSRSGEGNEGPRPLTPSRTPGTPIKPRLTRVGTSPTKRDEKPREEKVLKSSAKDVAELKDYVWSLLHATRQMRPQSMTWTWS